MSTGGKMRVADWPVANSALFTSTTKRVLTSWVQTYAWVLRNLFEYLLRIVFSQSTLAQTKQKITGNYFLPFIFLRNFCR